MTITARKLDDRDIYEVSYDNSTGAGLVTAKFHNQANGDKSSKRVVDDGTLDVSVAYGYEGTDSVKIEHEDGTVLDEGEIEFA
jgi:hypothetical protein